jgi:transmembrane 9 superfamily protein 2/4
MAAVTLLFAVLGFLSPSNRGSLVTALVTTFMLFGSVSGFVSARLYKMFGGENWRSNMIMTAFLFPGFVFSIFLILNFFLLAAGSSAAVPAGTIFGVIALWFLISAPLSFAGGYFGFKKPRVIQPVKTNQIPRQIPDQPLYLKFLPTILVGGILPFGAIFIELYLIMNSLWFHKLYYVFGFLFVVFVVLSITCAEIAILLAYFHLCSENYNWWWRSFLTSGTTGFYAFLYSVIFFISRLKHISAVSAVIYFGWAIVTSAFIFILTGKIITYSKIIILIIALI